MTNDELKMIIEKHKKWLKRQEGGECANLSDAILSYADLHGASLSSASLSGANLLGADLHGASLCGADLYGANLSGANLRGADLYGANLRRAILYNADLRDTDLRDTDLRGADLSGAKHVQFIPMTCPDSGSFTGWKKAHGYIVKLLIPEDAKRSSATGRKCRCDKALVVAIETVNGESSELNEVTSNHDETFIYKVGETVTVPNFCEDQFKECAEGIHFFINRQEAVDYH